MTNPFDNEANQFLALMNDEGQHSLWPMFAEIPQGWKAVHGPADKASCLDYVAKNWTDLRPNSLALSMAEAAAARGGNGVKGSGARTQRRS